MSRLILKNGASFVQTFRNFLPVISNSNKKGAFEKRKRSYSSGVVVSPLENCLVPKESLVEYIFRHSENFVDEPALTCALTGRSYTYGFLRMLINRCAQALLGHCGLKPREVVGLLLPNIPEYAIVSFGAIEAGLVVTSVNPLYTPDELKRQFGNAGVKMIITVPPLLELAMKIVPQLDGYKTTICIGGDDEPAKNIHGLQSLLTAGHEAELPDLDLDAVAMLPYSSGTSGLPKGVMLTQFNLLANLAQCVHPAMIHDKTKAGQRHTVINVLPFFHIYGFNGALNASLLCSAHVVTMPRFEPDNYIKALIEHRPTYLFVVPSLVLFLASHPGVTREHLSSLEAVHSGAAPLTEGVIQKFKEKLGHDDITIRQGYGMTETSPVTFCMPKVSPKEKIGTVGPPYPGTEAKVISLTTGEVLGPNDPGELLVKGPQIMLGYLNNEEATKEIIDKDGWLHTGDVAYYDEDKYFYIVDRCKDLIKVKGFQVAPTELENLLLEIPGVVDAAVVGIPDAVSGELPKAFVVKRPESKLSENEISSIVKAKVANFKRLDGGIKFVESIPRNPSGKIMRNELKKMAQT